MKPENLRPVLLVVRFDECFRFYRDLMGFNVGWGKEGDNYASFFIGEEVRLSIFRREQMAKVIGTDGLPSDAISQDRIALTFGVQDIGKTVNELKNKGACFITPIIDRHDWGVRTIFLRDPDGNLLQIESAMRKDEWTEELRKEAEVYRGET